MKKFYVAANILGAVEVKADTPEQAHAKASQYPSKKFKLQPMPTGLWVFERPPQEAPKPDAGSGT